jgi:hypothetical protein
VKGESELATKFAEHMEQSENKEGWVEFPDVAIFFNMDVRVEKTFILSNKIRFYSKLMPLEPSEEPVTEIINTETSAPDDENFDFADLK